MTVAIDVIVSEISEPIRFSMEAMSRVFHEHERFYKTPQTVVSEEFTLVLEVRIRTEKLLETHGNMLLKSVPIDFAWQLEGVYFLPTPSVRF